MINLHHLNYFLDAARIGSLAGAARKHRISQSAVSQSIRSLERVFGFDLISHERKVFQLTDEAKAMLPECISLLERTEALISSAQQLQKECAGELRIGCTHSLAIGFLPSSLSSLRTAHPRVHPRVQVGNSESIKAWLQESRIDLGILADDGASDPAFNAQVFAQGRYELFKNRKLQGSVFDHGIIATRKERSEVRSILEGFRKCTGRWPELHSEIISWEAIKKYVAQGGGFGICPDYVLGESSERKRFRLVRLPFPNPTYRLVALHRSDRILGRNAGEFLRILITGHRDPSSRRLRQTLDSSGKAARRSGE